MNIPDLRSPHDKISGIVYFGRMLDKIRLFAAGNLPSDYQENLGLGFDERLVKFLHIDYSATVERVKQGGSDEELLEWAFTQGRKPTSEEIEVWNDFMRKRGWNDAVSSRLVLRLNEAGFGQRTDIQTLFDFIDLDEDRDPALSATH